MSSENINASFHTNHEMALMLLNLRSMQRTKPALTSSLLPSSTNTIVDDDVQQEPMSRSVKPSNIPLLLSRRCHHGEQHDIEVKQRPQLKRTELIRLLNEALSISDEAEFSIIPEEERKKAKVFVTQNVDSHEQQQKGSADVVCNEDI